MQQEGYPVLHTWDGRGNPDNGIPIYDGTGSKITMSGDGNTIHLDSWVSKKSWPSSR